MSTMSLLPFQGVGDKPGTGGVGVVTLVYCRCQSRLYRSFQ